MSPEGAAPAKPGSAPFFYSMRKVSVITVDQAIAFPSSVAGL